MSNNNSNLTDKVEEYKEFLEKMRKFSEKEYRKFIENEPVTRYRSCKGERFDAERKTYEIALRKFKSMFPFSETENK